MAENAEQTEKAQIPAGRALASARAFVTAHGKPSRAVVQPIGRAGARVVLVGADGAMGDVVVPSPEAGTALIDAVPDLDGADWDTETVNSTVIGHAHRRRMGRSLLRG